MMRLSIVAGLSVGLMGAPTTAAPAAENAVIQRLEAAWNAHDARRYAEQFADDADLVTAGGTILHGKSAIESQAARSLASDALSGSQRRAVSVTLHPLASEATIARVTWIVSGAPVSGRSGLGDHTIVETGVLRRMGDAWRIVSLQATTAFDSANADPSADTMVGSPTPLQAPKSEPRRCIVARKNGDCVIYGKRGLAAKAN